MYKVGLLLCHAKANGFAVVRYESALANGKQSIVSVIPTADQLQDTCFCSILKTTCSRKPDGSKRSHCHKYIFWKVEQLHWKARFHWPRRICVE